MSETLAQMIARLKAQKSAQVVPAGQSEPQSSVTPTTSVPVQPTTISSTDRLALLRAKLAEPKPAPTYPSADGFTDTLAELAQQTPSTTTAPSSSGELMYNAEQQAFIDLATAGRSCVLIGAAGTGKTTCMKGTMRSLIENSKVPLLRDEHKYLTHGSPGIVACSFTRRAVSNLSKAIRDVMPHNHCTIHALLEYEPVVEEIEDPETGLIKSRKVFKPTRNALRPLDPNLQVIVIDESSMVAGSPFPEDSYLLFNQLVEATPHKPQIIFLGDINQLPPVFGSAILGYKMLELPVIELKQVYRQAQESPIIKLAHRILSGKVLPAEEFPSWNVPEKLTIHAWKKQIKAEDALLTLGVKFFKEAYINNLYNPDEDIILIPYNKACGTDELNKYIANFIARDKQRITYEVIAGYEKKYFSVGDKILVDKKDATVTKIVPNKTYIGRSPQKQSEHLDYWGYNPQNQLKQGEGLSYTEQDIDDLLSATSSDNEERKRSASHIIYFTYDDTGSENYVDSAGEVNGLILSYALTVHKSQGSEWRKVFFVLHNSHSTMISRELLYTGVTRAREELYIICEPNTFVNGIRSQRIKGNTLAEKAEFFKGKLE